MRKREAEQAEGPPASPEEAAKIDDSPRRMMRAAIGARLAQRHARDADLAALIAAAGVTHERARYLLLPGSRRVH